MARAGGNSEQFTVCIDADYAGFNTDQHGEALFDKQGEQSPLIAQAMDFLKDYEKLRRATAVFCKILLEFDLLEPMRANIEIKPGEKHALGGFQCVKREKLSALKQKHLVALVKSGQMELIYLHLFSLGNITALINKLNSRKSA